MKPSSVEKFVTWSNIGFLQSNRKPIATTLSVFATAQVARDNEQNPAIVNMAYQDFINIGKVPEWVSYFIRRTCLCEANFHY